MQMKITNKFVDNLNLPQTVQVLISDSELMGFGIGLGIDCMWFLVRGRTKGKWIRITIGQHGYDTRTIPAVSQRKI